MKSPEVNATFAEMAAHYGVADESPSRPKNRRIAASSFAIRSVAGTCSPGHSVAIMIVFFDVSIPTWTSPAGDATLDMTAGSFPA